MGDLVFVLETFEIDFRKERYSYQGLPGKSVHCKPVLAQKKGATPDTTWGSRHPFANVLLGTAPPFL